MIAPRAPAAKSAAFMRPMTGSTGSTTASRLLVSAAATRLTLRVRSASMTRSVPTGSACQPAGTRPYTSRVDSGTRGFTSTSA